MKVVLVRKSPTDLKPWMLFFKILLSGWFFLSLIQAIDTLYVALKYVWNNFEICAEEVQRNTVVFAAVIHGINVTGSWS